MTSSNLVNMKVLELSGGRRVVVSGADSAWFGPAQPLAPMAPPSVGGRRFDYPFAVNLYRGPKSFDGASFSDLRNLADNCYLVRLAIETRKDQLEAERWTIRPRDPKKKTNRRCRELEEFFNRPDARRDWGSWLRELMEDLFVIDAPALYIRPTVDGEPHSLEVVDGATIKRLINPDGRTPEAPEPAYQQILKGLPAVNYTTEELIYFPRNTRSNRLYGFSPVEQILTVINLALRRDTHKLNYYEKGTIPDGFLTSPDGWNLDQVNDFQLYLNTILSGDLEARRQMLVLPSGMQFHDTKEVLLKDEMDEWLARVVCFAFSLNPQAFVKQMNRATSEVAQDASIKEGLEGSKIFVKRLIDFIIATVFKNPDLIFEWEALRDIDPLQQAQIDEIYLRNGVDTEDEVRARRGLDPLPDDVKQEWQDRKAAELASQTGQNQPDNSQENDGQTGKITKKRKKKALKPINRKSRAVRVAVKKARGVFTEYLAAVKKEILPQLADLLGLNKADETTEEKVARILAELEIESFDDLPDDIKAILTTVVDDGQALTANSLAITEEVDLKLMNKKARQYAATRSAELVKQVSDSTREMIKSAVTQAIEEGWSTDQLSESLQDNQAFSAVRADRIARTEIAKAHVEGSMQIYRESGLVVKKKWLLSTEPCPICEENASDGVIDIDENFSSGDDAPPAHPNCECDVIPITDDSAQGNEDD